MDDNYKCPEWILNKLTKEVMIDFKNNLCEVFSKNLNGATELTEFDIDGMSSTMGWSEAFKGVCVKYNLQDILEYQDKLDWYDWDQFVFDVDSLLYKYEIVRRSTEEEYLNHYGDYEE